MKKILRVLAVAVFVLLLGFQTTTYATPFLTLSDGNHSNDLNIYDGGTLDSNTAVGVVTYIGSIGVWNINVSTGIADAGTPYMDLNSVNRSTSASKLTITFSESGFTYLDSAGNASYLFSAGGTTQGGVTFTAYVDTTTLASLGPYGVGAFSGDKSGSVGTDTPYSLMIEAVIDHGTGDKVTSFDAQLTPVPEPTTMLLLGLGLLGIGIVSRKK